MYKLDFFIFKKRTIMKKQIITVAVATALLSTTGCNSIRTASSGADPGASATTAISEQRVAASEFKRQGIKVYYTLTGNLEAIEATGYAPVWGNSENALRESYRVAELEAKKSLNDFINRETITSAVSVKMISQNLEQATDKKLNNFTSNRSGDPDELVTSDDAVSQAKTAQNTRADNTAVHNDAVKISSAVNTAITNTNRGILGGLYLVDGQAINNGNTVRVIMRWDRKHEDIRLQVRGWMMR
jgi:hypothetical protein